MPEPLFDVGAFSATNGPIGVLLLHGYTGSPRSLRPLAEAFADAGFSVELPLLPGHGTTPEDLSTRTFADWLGAAELHLSQLGAHCDHVVVVGHSMGGALALALVLANASIDGLILINPLVAPPAPSFVMLLEGAMKAGSTMIPSIGGDTMRKQVRTGGYDKTPIAPLLTLMDATPSISIRISEIVCPTLLFSSRIDHVVPTESSDLVEAEIGGPIERVMLENSYHIATLDNDAGEIESRSVAFVAKVCAA